MSRKKVKADMTEKMFFLVFLADDLRVFLKAKNSIQFLQLTDQQFILQFWDKHNSIENLMAVILIENIQTWTFQHREDFTYAGTNFLFKIEKFCYTLKAQSPDWITHLWPTRWTFPNFFQNFYR